ncbi:MAG: hypothetical protein KGO96_06965 [Elusimicrobia bacterium]|nr:hypothetical protein [Elusimicrobiota bacterium]
MTESEAKLEIDVETPKEAPTLSPAEINQDKGPVFIYAGDYQNPLVFLRISGLADKIRIKSFIEGAKGVFKLVAISNDIEFKSKKYKVLTYDEFVKQWKGETSK